jgi:hypothetical protein
MPPIDTFTFEHEGAQFLASVYADDSMGEPWKEEDVHGPVRLGADKSPGELVLSGTSRRGEKVWLYDYAEACRIALRDAWGVPGGMLPGESRRAYAARAALDDFKRLRAWCRDEWSWVGVAVQRVENGTPVGDPFEHALWGVESDSGAYLREVATELTY